MKTSALALETMIKLNCDKIKLRLIVETEGIIFHSV